MNGSLLRKRRKRQTKNSIEFNSKENSPTVNKINAVEYKAPIICNKSHNYDGLSILLQNYSKAIKSNRTQYVCVTTRRHDTF